MKPLWQQLDRYPQRLDLEVWRATKEQRENNLVPFDAVTMSQHRDPPTITQINRPELRITSKNFGAVDDSGA